MRGCKHHTFYKANAENPRNLEFPDLRAGSLRSPPLNHPLDPFLPLKWLIGGINESRRQRARQNINPRRIQSIILALQVGDLARA